MGEFMRIPNRALKRPVEPVPTDATDREFEKALVKSGLVYMAKQCYPSEVSQQN